MNARQTRAGSRLALAAAGGLALLAAAVSMGWLAWLDHGLLSGLAAMRGPLPDGFFQAVTWLGSGYVLTPATLLLLAYLLARRRWRMARLMGVTYFGAVVSVWLLKQAIGRERPVLYPALADFIRFDWSFPSGHTTHAAAFALGVWLLARESGRGGGWTPLLLLTGVLLVAMSRLYLQVHWPSDVLAGILLATAWAGLATLDGRRDAPRGVGA